jgi:hypothetical protein
MMASVFGPRWLPDLGALPRDLRRHVAAIVRDIERNPEPDGIYKRALPPPFKPGTISAVAHGLSVRYSIEVDGLRFYRVQIVDL